MKRYFYVKKLVIVLFIFLIIFYCVKSYQNFSSAAEQCDLEKNYTCSYYEVRNYMIRGN